MKIAVPINQYPLLKALVIRGISDLLNNKSETDSEGSQDVAAAAAAAFAFELIYQLDLTQLQLPKMDLKELTNEVLQIIQPKLDQLLGKSSNMPTNAQQIQVWEKIKPAITEEIEELQDDPTDTMVLNSIPGVIRKFLKKQEVLQEELSTFIQQNKQVSSIDNSIGQQINNHGNIDNQVNIKENHGTFNFDNSTTNVAPKNLNEIHSNQGQIHIGDIINIHQVLEQSPTTLSDPEKEQLKEAIQQLISTNKIKAALEKLLQLTKNGDTDLHSQVILLSNRWNRLKSEKNAGILTSEQANISQNRIMMAILSLVEEL